MVTLTSALGGRASPRSEFYERERERGSGGRESGRESGRSGGGGESGEGGGRETQRQRVMGTGKG